MRAAALTALCPGDVVSRSQESLAAAGRQTKSAVSPVLTVTLSTMVKCRGRAYVRIFCQGSLMDVRETGEAARRIMCALTPLIPKELVPATMFILWLGKPAAALQVNLSGFKAFFCLPMYKTMSQKTIYFWQLYLTESF